MRRSPATIAAVVAALGVPIGCCWLALWQMQGQEADLLAMAQAWLTGTLMAAVAAPLGLALPRSRTGHAGNLPLVRSGELVPVLIRSKARRRR